MYNKHVSNVLLLEIFNVVTIMENVFCKLMCNILLLGFVSIICIVGGSVHPGIPVTWILRTK